jgi:MFS family permease
MTQTHSMDRRQLLVICICFGLMVFEATLTLGVIPVHVVRLGADPAATGLYMAFSFFGVTAGNILGGWLTDRFGQRKRHALIGFLLWIPAALLLTQATTVPGITFISGLMWLPGGIAIAALNSIVGLSAGEHERGRVFGLMTLSTGAGGLIAGLIGGSIAEQWGFPALFVLMAILPGVMLLITTSIRDVSPVPASTPQTPAEPAVSETMQVRPGVMVYLLLLATLFARLGLTVSDLGRPLAMLQINLNAADISNAIAFSAAATLPLPLILGWLSDRIGRKRLLVLFYSLGAVGILLLTMATEPWHFWLSAALAGVIIASNGIGQAYIADLSDAKTIGRNLSLFTSSGFIASMIGLGGAGYIMQGVGIQSTLLMGVGSLVIAVLLLLRMHPVTSSRTSEMIEAAPETG